MKKIRFEPNVPAEIRVTPQPIAMTILGAIQRYAETGAGRVKPRVGSHRVFFKETADTITIHRIRDRRNVCR